VSQIGGTSWARWSTSEKRMVAPASASGTKARRSWRIGTFSSRFPWITQIRVAACTVAAWSARGTPAIGAAAEKNPGRACSRFQAADAPIEKPTTETRWRSIGSVATSESTSASVAGTSAVPWDVRASPVTGPEYSTDSLGICGTTTNAPSRTRASSRAHARASGVSCARLSVPISPEPCSTSTSGTRVPGGGDAGGDRSR
jgi:hypothetical protein